MKELEEMQNYELFTVITAGIKILRENERKQGYEDGRKENLANAMIHDHEIAEKTAYEKGLNDVWEVIKKITEDEGEVILQKLFNYVSVYDITHNYTPDEAIAKIKEYEEKRKKRLQQGVNE